MSHVQSKPYPVALLGWKSLQRNSLRGFARIRLGTSMIISDVAVHCAHGRRWAQAPAKPQLDKDGNAKRDDKGKVAYVPIIEWADREASDKFSEAVIAAVEREHPGATESTYGG
jgi:hypothetical protein